MGTRSLTVFNDTWENEEIAVFYRQFDGYPEGHGTDLLDLLKDMSIVNGMNSKNMKSKIHAMKTYKDKMFYKLDGRASERAREIILAKLQ